MLKGLITLLLLWLLGDREDYGYALVVRLHEAGLSDIAEGTVYPALARCEPITTAGGDELTRSLDSWNHLAALVSAITSKGTLR